MASKGRAKANFQRKFGLGRKVFERTLVIKKATKKHKCENNKPSGKIIINSVKLSKIVGKKVFVTVWAKASDIKGYITDKTGK